MTANNSNSSIPPSYFENLYAADSDPWRFATSRYEADKYAATIAALPKNSYRSGFEIGGSIGILTEKLAERCDSLLSIDVSETAQQQAIERCDRFPHLRFQLMQFPEQQPDETFDLIVVSEVGYYWSWGDLKRAQKSILNLLEPGGHLMLVHWTEETNYPLTGDEVHDFFSELVSTQMQPLVEHKAEQYRLDLFERRVL
ncbi:MAG: SAM-dependent methyltransferase [Cyanobacteriota bacterium]|nr:SAM-dependent methyltransferase [Cyanobacteriota bacterium]